MKRETPTFFNKNTLYAILTISLHFLSQISLTSTVLTTLILGIVMTRVISLGPHM